jgi:hypothetical protein
MVIWNKVTWYSKLAAVILFIGVLPVLTFYIGTQYEATVTAFDQAGLPIGSVFHTKTPLPTNTDSSVEGDVVIGPTCPVERIPPDPSCDPKPYPTTLILSSTQKGKNGGVLLKTDAQGHFSTNLAPGVYTIKAQSETLPRLDTITFTLAPHQHLSLLLSFDSGIR